MCQINRPNYYIFSPQPQYTYLGDNNLKREFRNCFEIILSSCYEDATLNARYYNKQNEDGSSSYYVPQLEIESELRVFEQSATDIEKYLIGFTGIGKTTLLKNFFKIEKEDPFLTEEGNLVAYLSVFSDDIRDTKDLLEVFTSFLQTIVNKLLDLTPFNYQWESDQHAFYEYASNKKKRLIIEDVGFESKPLKEVQLLDRFKERHPLDFYTTLISFLIGRYTATTSKNINIILIYDDIEAQDPIFHIPFISNAQSIFAKLKETAEPRSYVVRSLIAIRNYTYRYHFARQCEARREYIEDVILKTSIPTMKEIFNRRFKVYYDNEDVRKLVSNEARWLSSTEILAEVVNNISDFGETISAVAHYDISHSLKMFLRVLTNHRWFAPNEEIYNGAYKLRPEDYLSVKERTLKALVYGEGEVFVDNEENLFPNILRYHKEEGNEDIEIISLYVLEYMLSLQRANEVTLYGRTNINGLTLENSIKRILQIDNSDIVERAIERLYLQRCILRSIFQAEEQGGDHQSASNRHYENSYNLYLSLRGSKLMEMLERDSLLLEIYRDDIDTAILRNTIPSYKMTQTEKMIYLIEYCRVEFDKERRYLICADKEEYFRNFGGGFIVSRLIQGLCNTYKYFYRTDDENARVVRKELQSLLDSMWSYANYLKTEANCLNIRMPVADFRAPVEVKV